MSRRDPIVLTTGNAAFPAPALPDSVEAAGLLADSALIVAAGLLSRVIYQHIAGVSVELSVYLGASLMLAVTFTLLMRSRSSGDGTNLLTIERQIGATAFCWTVAFSLALGVAFLVKVGADLSRGAVLLFGLLGLLAVVVRRVLWRFGVTRVVSRGALRTRKVFLLSPQDAPATDAQLAALKRSGIDIVQTRLLPRDEAERASALASVVAAIRHVPVDEIVVALSSDALPQLDEITAHLRMTPLPVRLLPDAGLSELTRQRSRSIGPFALVDITREPLGPGERAWKRVLDVTVAGVALLMVAPLLVLAFAAIRLDTPGPVLFRQSRRGFNGRPFKILKLRTMSVLEDGEGIAQATKRDPRVTRVGRWLRRTSIDELPQLWNVLRGEMSIVGPRPHAVAHDTYYDKLIEKYAYRHHVKPGLTGWAQVNGLRGETPDVSMMAARIDHDVWYISNWSLLLDVRILLLTATKLLPKSAY